MSLVVGVDVGTSGCKVSVLDEQQRVVGRGSASYASLFPSPGHVEQHPSEWIRGAETALAEGLAALERAGRRRSEVAALAFSGPTHVAVLLGSDGEPVRPAIMWNDQRSHAEADQLAPHRDRIREITDNTPGTSWTLCHLMWLGSRGLLAGVRRVAFMKDWVRGRFCAGSETWTDRVDALGALLLDTSTGEWSEEIRELGGLPELAFPEIGRPDEIVGVVDDLVADRLGLARGVSVVLGTTDTATELLAAGAVRVGDSAVKIASAGNVATIRERLPGDSRLLAYEYVLPGTYYWNSATASAATSVDWAARTLLGLGDESDRFLRYDGLVAGSARGAAGVTFVPHLNGERSPLFDPSRRAVLCGLSQAHTSSDIARAVMEGVAYSLKAAADLQPSLPETLALIGGGARSSVWPQIIADVLARPVRVVRDSDSSIGTAILAGAGIGNWSLAESMLPEGHIADRIVPPATDVEVYREGFARYSSLVAASGADAFRAADVSSSAPVPERRLP